MIFSINNKKRNLVKSKKAARKLRFQALRSADVLPSVRGAPSDERFAGQPRVTELPAEHRTKAENTGPLYLTR